MTIVVLHFRLMIGAMIRKARKRSAITQGEADYLIQMAQEGLPVASTMEFVDKKGSPDFLYSALYFSTMIWQLGEAADSESEGRAGYKLAQFVLSHESPEHDSYWAAKLLREFYEAHKNSIPDRVGSVA